MQLKLIIFGIKVNKIFFMNQNINVMYMVMKIKVEQLFLFIFILMEDMWVIYCKYFVYLKKVNLGQKKMCLIIIYIKKI